MKGRIYLAQIISYTAIMLSISYTPRIASQLGATFFQVALVYSMYNLAYFLSSMIFGRLADVHGRKRFIISGFVIASIVFMSQYFYRDYYSLLLLRIMAGFAAGIFPAAIVSMAHDTNLKMGKLSAYGALGWALGSYFAGLISLFFPFKVTYLFSSLIFLSGLLVVWKLPDTGVKIKNIPMLPKEVMFRNWAVYLSYIFRHSAATMIWAYWPLFIKSIGGNSFWQAATMGVNSTVQFFLMYFYTDVRRYTQLILLGLVLSSLTFLSYAFAINIWMIIPIQVLLATSWSFLYVGSLRYLTDRNPEKATATGLLNSSIGISAFLGPLIGGVFMHFFSHYRSLMLFSFLLSSIAIVIFFIPHRKEI